MDALKATNSNSITNTGAIDAYWNDVAEEWETARREGDAARHEVPRASAEAAINISDDEDTQVKQEPAVPDDEDTPVKQEPVVVEPDPDDVERLRQQYMAERDDEHEQAWKRLRRTYLEQVVTL